MVIVQDDFLDPVDFAWFVEKAKKVSDTMKHDLATKGPSSKNRIWGEYNWNTCYFDLNDDHMIASVRVGKDLSPVLNKIIDVVKEKGNLDPIPKLNNVFFMFSKNGYIVDKHRDTTYARSSKQALEGTFKAFIFCHDTWKEEWGGHLCFDCSENLPKPNRLVIFSMDETHWVNLVKDAEVERSIFGVRWGTDA